jgi:hypothetical protein
LEVLVGVPEVSMQPLDPAQLADQELVKLFCANPKEHALATELWRRYGDAIHEELKHLVFGRNSLCPDSCPRATFLDASFSRAWERLFGNICRFRRFDKPSSLKAWSRRVAYSVAIEEYRDITACRKHIWNISLEEAFPCEGEGAEDEDTPVFRSRYSNLATERTGRGVMAQPLPAPDAKTKAEERKYVTRDLLVRYAQESDENAHCARLIRLRHFLDWELTKIVAHVYGTAASPRQQKTWERYVLRDMAHDYEELRGLLKREFGITALSQV